MQARLGGPIHSARAVAAAHAMAPPPPAVAVGYGHASASGITAHAAIRENAADWLNEQITGVSDNGRQYPVRAPVQQRAARPNIRAPGNAGRRQARPELLILIDPRRLQFQHDGCARRGFSGRHPVDALRGPACGPDGRSELPPIFRLVRKRSTNRAAGQVQELVLEAIDAWAGYGSRRSYCRDEQHAWHLLSRVRHWSGFGRTKFWNQGEE